jgi:RNA polymerase sigma-70 factor (ECF subfamily)
VTHAATHLSVEHLLEHESFVRAVACGLLHDEHAADDVTQDVILKSLQDAGTPRPASVGGLRNWFATVTRNAVRDARRQSTRREAREERAARAEAQESVAVAFERLSLQREVVGAILALDEPYRSVVLMRYYHDLEPTEIAARLGAKPATVRTQLVRAHELLRTKLDAHRERRAWALLLVPENVTGAVREFRWIGALTAVAATVVVATLWFATRETSGAEPELVGAVEPITTPAREANVELSAPPFTQGERERGAGSTSSSSPATAATAPRVFERAELFDGYTYKDREDAYERATFSFVHGLRDDPENIARNDWDVQFSNGKLRTHMVVNDYGLIVDLGAVRLADLAAMELAVLRAKVAGAATVRFAAASHGKQETFDDARAARGHTYFVWTLDDDTDETAAFEVLELAPAERCLLEWYASSDGSTGRGSLAAPAALAGVLGALREEVRAQRELRAPRVWLQVRTGARGGNPNRIDMSGNAMSYIQRIEGWPLDVTSHVDSKEESRAYVEGGFVPQSRVFVVTRVTYSGSARGDSNGPGGFRLVLGGQALADHKSTDELIQGVWNGNIEIAPGAERDTYLELRNSSAGEAVFEGHWKTP